MGRKINYFQNSFQISIKVEGFSRRITLFMYWTIFGEYFIYKYWKLRKWTRLLDRKIHYLNDSAINLFGWMEGWNWKAKLFSAACRAIYLYFWLITFFRMKIWHFLLKPHEFLFCFVIEGAFYSTEKKFGAFMLECSEWCETLRKVVK